MRFALFVAFACFVSPTPALPFELDYGKIDRLLRKEPEYEAKNPKYALLLFGEDAKVRVWIVLDGKTVYVDRNADGDLTGKDERFDKASDCKNIAIANATGKTRYKITSVSHATMSDPPCESLMAFVDIAGDREYKQYCDAFMDEDPQKAAIAHFDGPLVIEPAKKLWKLPAGLNLAVGEKPTELGVVVGTMNAQYKCWVVARSHHGDKYAFPKDMTPTVEVEYQAKNGNLELIKMQYPLDQFC